MTNTKTPSQASADFCNDLGCTVDHVLRRRLPALLESYAAEARADLVKERDEARANYQFMVDRAADEKLDGYRELAARAAKAEQERDEARTRCDYLGRAIVASSAYHVELERKDETGWWIAEIPELPGCLVYEETRALAMRAVYALALRIIADRIEHGESDQGAASWDPVYP
jgi:predicted RNase H-like HicB family nuclease